MNAHTVNGGRTAGILALTVTSLLWGTTGTAASFAPDVGPLAIGAAALGIAGLLQALIAAGAIREHRGALRERWRLVMCGGVAVAIYPLAFYSSMDAAGVAVGSIVSLSSAPLASGLLELLVDRRPLSRWWMLAALLGVVGGTLLCLSRMGGATVSADDTLLGIALGLVAGVTYATYSWAASSLIGAGIPRGASMGAVFGLGGALLMPVLVVTGAPILASAGNLAVVGYMALIPMFLGYLLFGYGLTKVPASTATVVTLTEPAIATVLAVLIVGERLSPLGWVGVAMIGVVLAILAVAPTNAVITADRRRVPAAPGASVE